MSTVKNADTVSLVCALLVRFPELVSIRSMTDDVRLTFALRARFDKAAMLALGEVISEHVLGYVALSGDSARFVRIECESDRGMTFAHVTRDTDSFSKDELELIIALFADRYGDALVRNPPPEDSLDADTGAQDEAALFAVEALRDPARSANLVGFREEARIIVHFLKSRRKAKARRSHET